MNDKIDRLEPEKSKNAVNHLEKLDWDLLIYGMTDEESKM